MQYIDDQTLALLENGVNSTDITDMLRNIIGRLQQEVNFRETRAEMNRLDAQNFDTPSPPKITSKPTMSEEEAMELHCKKMPKNLLAVSINVDQTNAWEARRRIMLSMHEFGVFKEHVNSFRTSRFDIKTTDDTVGVLITELFSEAGIRRLKRVLDAYIGTRTQFGSGRRTEIAAHNSRQPRDMRDFCHHYSRLIQTTSARNQDLVKFLKVAHGVKICQKLQSLYKDPMVWKAADTLRARNRRPAINRWLAIKLGTSPKILSDSFRTYHALSPWVERLNLGVLILMKPEESRKLYDDNSASPRVEHS